MKITSLQKAKIILALNFVVLFFIIISTPYFIRGDFFQIKEEFVEGFFLAAGLLALIFVFRHYDEQSRKSEEQAVSLGSKLKRKERELLNTLEYLGKVNVQISMIKSFFENIKIPSSRSNLKEIYAEILRIVSIVTREEAAMLRIVDLKSQRTLSEFFKFSEENKDQKFNFGNKELIELIGQDGEVEISKKNGKSREFYVFFSDVDNFYVKAFILIPKKKQGRFYPDERKFLKGLANQCEVVYLLFNSRYYKN